MGTKNQVAGFTLVELLIVIVIVGILTAIAVPSYNQHTLKSYRSDAYAALNEVMQAEERHAAEEGTYTVTLTDMGFTSPLSSELGRYQITAIACVAPAPTALTQCINLRATAQGAQTGDNNDGEDLDGDSNTHENITLNSQGLRGFW
jgi:type IV pilus assembly protein PilE